VAELLCGSATACITRVLIFGKKEFAVRLRKKQMRMTVASMPRLLLAGAVALGSFSGCNSGAENRSAQPTQTDNQAGSESAAVQQDLLAGVNAKQQLIGVWLGQALLDEEALLQKLKPLSPPQRTEVLRSAEEFLTTVMAMELRGDGSMEKEFEITPNGGQPLRDGGSGAWRIVESKGDQAVMETTATLFDGTVVTDRQLLRFYPDGNRLAVSVQLGDTLAGCNPQIVLYRQPLPDADLAERDEGTEVK
jgi:hypothetical protein